MAESKISCPKCGGHIAFPNELAGHEIQCPHCNETILLPKRKRPVIWLVIATGAFILVVTAFILVAAHHPNRRKSQPLVAKSEFEILQNKAAKGDSEAMTRLGLLYLYGNGVLRFTLSNGMQSVGNTIPTNNNKGLEWLRKAAALRDPHAMTALGNFYYQKWQNEETTNTGPIDPATGLPVVPSIFAASSTNGTNYSECMTWYGKAADLGDTNAMWQIILNGNVGTTNSPSELIDPTTGLPVPMPSEETIHWLRKLADGGDTAAMVELGSFYISETNTDDGLKWLDRAANLGDKSAWTTLAQIYESGSGGVPTNMEKAITWWTKAATNGDLQSELHLGKLYLDNDELKNPPESFKWFLKVAQQFDSSTGSRRIIIGDEALVPVAEAYDKGLGVTQNMAEAMRWYRKAAEWGDTEAEWRLGVKYDLGDGVDVDKQKAMEWYLKAANTPVPYGLLPGVAEAQRNIGMLYQSGDGVLKDDREAFNWFMKAAENGDSYSQYEVGKAYDTGIGVLQDKEVAGKWYRKAAYQGNKSAEFALGNLYGGDLYSPENRVEAYKWYALAAAQGDEDAAKLRDIVARTMTAEEIAEANQRAKAFSIGEPPTNNVRVAVSSSGAAANAGIDLNKPAFQVLNATARVTERNDMWWRFAYRLTVRNNGMDNDRQFYEIQFLDADGYVIDTKTEEAVIKPGATEIITGDTLIDLPGAARVSKLKAFWKR